MSRPRHGKVCPLTPANFSCYVQVAGLLKEWLRALPEPIIDLHLYGAVLQTQQRRTSVERLNSLQRTLKQVGGKRSGRQHGCCPAVPVWASQMSPRSICCPWNRPPCFRLQDGDSAACRKTLTSAAPPGL